MYFIPNDVTALSFDIWKTLFSGNASYTWPRLELVFGYVGILDYGQDAITASYKRAEAELNLKAEQTGFDTGMRERIEYVLQDLGITDKVVPSAEEIIVLQKRSGELRVLPEFLPQLMEPDLVNTLRSLKAAGYTLGTLSNTGMGDCHMVKPVLTHYGLDEVFDVTLFSCEDGRAKPNPDLFREMAAQLRVDPEQVLHVGDNAFADGKAVDVGMNAVLYAPKGVYASAIPVIASMRELLG